MGSVPRRGRRVARPELNAAPTSTRSRLGTTPAASTTQTRTNIRNCGAGARAIMGGCVFPDPTPPDPCANDGCDPGPPPNPCEGCSNCGGGDPGTGPGDPCGGQCGGPEPRQPPDPGPASPTPTAPPADRCGGCTDSNRTNPSSSPHAGDVFTFLGHDIGPIVDVVPTGTGVGGLWAGDIDASLWNVESAVSAVLLTPYELAYAFNTHHPGGRLGRGVVLGSACVSGLGYRL